MKSHNFGTIKGWKPLTNEEVMLSDIENFSITEAKMKDVYTEVPDGGQKSISVRWVITEQIDEGKLVFKA